MTEVSPKARLMRDWLLSEWTEKLAVILESMADERPTIEHSGPVRDAGVPGAESVVWSQQFVVHTEPVMWVATPRTTAIDLGTRTLNAAGVETSGDEESHNTFLEILNQSLSALGQSIGSHLATDAAATTGEQIDAAPENLEWMSVQIRFSTGTLEPVRAAFGAVLLDRLAAGAKQEQSKPPAAKAPEPENEMTEAVTTPPVASKTFDLLLDVALPVCISFGRTVLPIKDVLKLTTGSIVELDRALNEPVDVIVNNCVIARGEVVVVEGNYGVRIQQIASRYDRLRTGSGAAQVQHALVGN